MASIVLSGIGGAIGGMIAGPLGAKIGYGLGALAGSTIDSSIFGGARSHEISGSRLADLAIQTSTYGKAIPILFGQSRFAGNVIWSLPLKEYENRSSHSAGGGKGGGKRSITSVTYTYTATLAIALCEGPLDSIINIWADAKNITKDINKFRIYKGTEDQMPDPLIEAQLGIGKTPAYRGLAYIVIEDFPLGDYGNRIPNFTFEAKRKSRIHNQHCYNTSPMSSRTPIEDIVQYQNTLDNIHYLSVHETHASAGMTNGNDNVSLAEMPVEDRLTAICIIPGSGEFVYDTQVQYKVNGSNIAGSHVQNGKASPLNMNNPYNKADSIVALDQLQETCKNIKWVAPVVGWFGTSLNIGHCHVAPGVEFRENLHTSPDVWQVAGKVRRQAHQITLKNGSPIYGGTVSDNSMLRYLEEIKRRNFKIMLYPMLFVDLPDKPWRGHMFGEAGEVENFFKNPDGYNNFILHYAKLAKGKIDAFIIGSELKKITAIEDANGNYPAVKCLIDLARQVKEILGKEVKVTYAADWSEYHHTDGGWHHLDDLWASDYIDFIGIDAYFPLTRKADDIISEDEVIKSWDSGELYDYYYIDLDKKNPINLSPEYALKNIKYWWENYHFNPDRQKTKWVPKSKKIWFTEFGFPSVDGATNQPNVFFDPEAYDGGLPYNSKGIVDLHTQRTAINGTLKKWEASDMVENLFLWTWDARPYPSWPVLDHVWGDGKKWDKGHWVNGKFGLSLLAEILAELSLRAGLALNQIDSSGVIDVVDGFIIDDATPARDIIDLLAKFYFFDATETNGKIKFTSCKYVEKHDVNPLDLIYHSNKALLQITRKEEQSLPRKLEIIYSDKNNSYYQNVSRIENHYTSSNNNAILNANIVLTPSLAKEKAHIMLSNAWNSRHSYKLVIPFKYIFIKPGDVLNLDYENEIHQIKVSNLSVISNRCLEIEGFSEDPNIYKHSYICEHPSAKLDLDAECHYISHILDIPAKIGAFKDETNVSIAVASTLGKFKPVSLYRLNQKEYEHIVDIFQESTIGTALEALSPANSDIFDFNNSLTVTLISGKLKSVTMDEVLSGLNVAMIGNEILQFMNARLISKNQYMLSGFLRGRMATESLTDTHKTLERFILLDEKITTIEMSLSYLGEEHRYKLVSDLENLDSSSYESFTWHGNSLKPLAPTHIELTHINDTQVEISWIRRSRLGGMLRDNVEAQLSEEKELYEIEFILDTQVLKTLESNKSCVVCDSSLLEKSSKILIYQISSIIGRGFPGIFYKKRSVFGTP